MDIKDPVSEVVSSLIDEGYDPNPPPPQFNSGEGDMQFVLKRPIAAIEYALAHGHHPKLWNAVKNSTYAGDYVKEVRGVPPEVKQEYQAQKQSRNQKQRYI